MMEIEEEAVEKLCIQVGLELAGSADEKYAGEGRSITEQGTEDTNVDMEEAIPLQAENHKILISSCAKPSRNTLESSEEPAGEKRFLSSSTSKLITEESPNEMMVFGSSCITSGSEPSGSQNETVNCVREVLLEEFQDLRSQFQYYTDSSSSSVLKSNSLLKLTYSCEPSLAPPLNTIQESSSEESPDEKLEIERTRWMDAKGKWISLAEELRAELDASRVLARKFKQELDIEKKYAEELKETIQMAMEEHACILEQYADLEEKHIYLLARYRRIHEGIDDVKKAASNWS